MNPRPFGGPLDRLRPHFDLPGTFYTKLQITLRLLAHSLEQKPVKAMPAIEGEDGQSEPEHDSRDRNTVG